MRFACWKTFAALSLLLSAHSLAQEVGPLSSTSYIVGDEAPVEDSLAGDIAADPLSGVAQASAIFGEAPECPSCPCDCCRCFPCECPCPPAACLPCPRINLINPCWQLLVGGNITLDMLYNSARPIAPGTPFLLAPQGPFNEGTFDMHARQTTMYFAAMGPEVGNFRSGGLILFNLYNDAVIVDRYGFLPIQAYGELKNEDWRVAGGLQVDVFAPLLPTVLPFSYLEASGNVGVYRGQLRLERFLYPTTDSQITLQAALSEPVSTIVNNDTLSEDNGWPNIEARAAWALGQPQQVGLEAKRPFEMGISGVVGQLRTTAVGPPPAQVVADRWGLSADFRWRVNEAWGVAGEVFTGQGLGNYGGGVFQNVNAVTFNPVHATGGWGEIYFYLTPCLHTHVGYGIDNPSDSELALTQIAQNKTAFANLIWDVTSTFRIAGEVTYRETDYILLPDNDGFGLQGQMQWKF